MFKFGMNMPVIYMSLYGSIMIVLICILRLIFRNKLLKFVFPALWCAVLMRFLVPFSVSVPFSLPMPERLIGWNMANTTLVAEDVDYLLQRNAQIPDEATASDGAAISAYPREMISAYTTEISVAEEAYGGTGSGFLAPHVGKTVCIIVYIMGAAVTAGILLWQRFRYGGRLKGSYLIEHNETINGLLRDMGYGHILVFSNDEIASPMVCGVCRPRIYLPARMDYDNVALLRYILAHEAMHIHHRDNLIKSAMLLVLCLNWYNPLVWMMSVCLASDLEAACDAAVMRQCGEENRKDYAFSLLSMAINGSRTPLLYSAFSKTEVEKRVKSILSYKKLTVLTLFAAVLFMSASMAAFASVGQAPFDREVTAFCGSDACRWGAKVMLTRDVRMGDNARKRAEDVVFAVLRTGEKDPQVIADQIKVGLSGEFGVEKGAFDVEVSFILSDEAQQEEYAAWGLTREEGSPLWKYRGVMIRHLDDVLAGHYQNLSAGMFAYDYDEAGSTILPDDEMVDVSIRRNDYGEIIAVDVQHYSE